MNNRPVYAFAGIGFVIIAVIGILITLASHARLDLVSTSPVSGSERVGTADILHFKFNKPLSADTSNNFSISPSIAGTVTIAGNELIFKSNKPYTLRTFYTATLKKPKGKDGSVGQDIKLPFTINPPNFSELTPQQKDDAINQPDPHEKIPTYTSMAVILSGDKELRQQGASDEQVASLQLAFYLYSTSLHREIRNVTQNNVNHIHNFNRSTGASSDAYTFDGTLDGKTAYKATATVVDLNTVNLSLYDSVSGNLLFDSTKVQNTPD